MASVLLADDDLAIRTGLKDSFEKEGFTVRVARDGSEALCAFDEERPDLVLLDVMMPKMNGFAACAAIRQRDHSVPILFLTAKDSESDEVLGMGLGADDYVSKASGLPILLARVHRALDRAEELAPQQVAPRVLHLGKVVVDLNRQLVVCDGVEQTLTSCQVAILSCLAERRGESCSCDDILTYARGEDFSGDPSIIRVHVMRLRKKLGPAADMIVNTRGGYYLVK